MKNLYKYCFIIITMISIIIPISAYAGKVRSLTEVVIECRKPNTLPSTRTYAADSRTQLSIAFNGIDLDNYKKGLITKLPEDMNDEEFNKMSEADFNMLAKIPLIHAVVTSAGIEKKINPGETFTCLSGASLTVKVYDPSCPDKKDKRAIFTLIEDKEVDDDTDKVPEKNSTETEKSFSDVEIPTSDFLGTSKKTPVNVKDKKCSIQ